MFMFQGQFNFAEVVIEPLDDETNLVTVQAKPGRHNCCFLST